MTNLSSESIIAIIGITLSFLGTWAIFILNGIKKSQDNTNKEIKEMNKDIRDLLIHMGKNDEKLLNVLDKVNDLEEFVKHIDKRVTSIETYKHG